jgi:hypothetical protein
MRVTGTMDPKAACNTGRNGRVGDSPCGHSERTRLMESNQFHQALNRLMNDDAYRATVKENPRQLLEDYQLTRDDIELMTQVRKAATKEDPDVQGYTWLEDVEDFFGELSTYTCCC